MKKFFGLAMILFSITSFAKSMEGSLGLGLGWYQNLDLLEPNTFVTKLGITPNLILEPEIYLYAERNPSGTTDTEHGLSLLIGYAIRGHEKTNLYLKGGLSYEIDNPASISATSIFGLAFGFGIEHFISEYFSVDLSALSFYYLTSYGEDYAGLANPYDFYLGNGFLRLAVFWYY